jgi:hypothetical protein
MTVTFAVSNYCKKEYKKRVRLFRFATEIFCQVVSNHAYCVAGKAQHKIIETHNSRYVSKEIGSGLFF